MSPSPVCCPYLDCDHKGLTDTDTISVHASKSREDRTPTRYHCAAGDRTFSARRCPPFYRLHHPAALMTIVLTLRAHGCPLPASVLALGLDERTVRAWLLKAGAHAAVVHAHPRAAAGGVATPAAHVQADEICVRVRGGRVWLAQASAVSTRLWRGGVVARRRDGLLVRHRRARVKAAVVTPAFLLLVDGVAPYVTAARALLRVPRRTGRVGRPPLGWPEGFLLGPVIKAGRRGGASCAGRGVGPRRRSPRGWRRRAAGRPCTPPTSSGSTRRRGSGWRRWCGGSARPPAAWRRWRRACGWWAAATPGAPPTRRAACGTWAVSGSGSSGPRRWWRA